jgi:hypothetical protein
MKRLFIILLIGLLPVTAVNLFGQAAAQISGTVRDPSGAVLPGVEVTATQTETGVGRTAITNETGSYILSNLAVGPYRLEATLPGFRTFVQTGIVLQVNSNPVVNPTLEIGQVTEQVEVQANVAQVDTRSTAVGQVIENERILELPLNGRQVTDLITLSGAAVQTAVGGRATWQGAVFISVAGGQSFGVMYSLDGAMHNNAYDGSQMPMPFPDALQEFKVEASGMSAAGGTRGSGGQVNAVTKSGTNDFHGNLFEFVRNYKFNARNFFARQRDSLKRNQYGGTVGGPIIANKLFFFGGFQGTKTRSDPGTLLSFVPTPALLAGDWTAFASPACNASRQITLGAPIQNYRVDPALYSKAALNIASKLPQAQDECGRANYGLVEKRNDMQVVSKVDYQASADHSLFGRYIATSLDLPHPYDVSGNLLTTISEGFDNLAQSYTLGSTYLLSPGAVNAFRLAVNRVAIVRPGAHFFSAPDIGVKTYSDLNDHIGVTVTGGFTIGSRGDSTFMTTSYQIGDDVGLVRGNHQMTFGGNLAHWRTNQRAHLADFGSYTFNGNALGLGMADFFLGRLTTLNQGTTLNYAIRQWYLGAYAADVWKATPKLSLSYGLRWEPFLSFDLTEGSMPNFSDERFTQGIRSTVYPNAPAGLYYPGDPGFPEGRGKPVYNQWSNLAPRVGLAWDPWGNGLTSIRASYGIAYDFTGSFFMSGASNSFPAGFQTTVQSPGGGFEDPWRDYPGGVPFPLNRSAAQFPLFSSFYLINEYDMATPSVQSFNLSVQRQLPEDFLLSASYLGSQTTHLWVSGNINRAVYFPGTSCVIAGVTWSPCSSTQNTNQRRRLFLQNQQQGQYYTSVAIREDGGTQSYHGLLLSVQRRAASGVNVGGNYTWSHCIGDAATGLATGPDSPGYLDPNNRDFDRGNCESDRRHVLNLTAVVSTPQFANPTLRTLATGWRLSGIYRRSSGSYLTLSTGLDRLLSGNAGNQRPTQILENPYGDSNSTSSYLNPRAFAQPDLGTMGNIRRSNVEGPGTWQFDIGLSRVFSVREAQRLEFRAEAFNVTNSLVRGNPSTTLNQNTFGQINSSSDARIMQFALKYAF